MACDAPDLGLPKQRVAEKAMFCQSRLVDLGLRVATWPRVVLVSSDWRAMRQTGFDGPLCGDLGFAVVAFDIFAP